LYVVEAAHVGCVSATTLEQGCHNVDSVHDELCGILLAMRLHAPKGPHAMHGGVDALRLEESLTASMSVLPAR
jgi:hypothetical protein